ncbi:hypothetical protein MANES_10G071662v8 [Manihot esculenta]|uniref:Uncharacterized protein n=1 Tax=Manihot esculenta TaxID=3983 RepID=A0ACB7GZI5_MANES|nr:hypothetical protein MANES_10G071662v8 [Manihot esculenta]
MKEKTHFNFRVFNKQFLGLVAISNTFEIVKNSNDSTRVRIRASNGFFLQVKTEELLTADNAGGSN